MERRRGKEERRINEANYSHFLLLSPTTVSDSRPRTISNEDSSNKGSGRGTRVFLRHGPAAAVPHDIADMSPRTQRVASSSLTAPTAYSDFLRVLGAAGDAPPRHITSARTRASRASARVDTLRYLARPVSLAHRREPAHDIRYYYRST